MENLKKLVENFFDYTTEISITESELYEKYYDKLSQVEKDYLESQNSLDYEIERMIKADILYDFIFDINGIKAQLTIDLDNFSEDSGEYRYIKTMYEEIKEVLPEFKINRLEEE